MTKNEFIQRAALALLANGKFLNHDGSVDYHAINFASHRMAEKLETDSDFVEFDDDPEFPVDFRTIFVEQFDLLLEKLGELNIHLEGISKLLAIGK